MDVEDTKSATESLVLADEATATAETTVLGEEQRPMRLYYGNGPRIHDKLCIAYGFVNRLCQECGQVGQLTCFSPSFRKWALRRVTREEMNLTCSLCKERGHKSSDCDLRVTTHNLQVEERRKVHCGICGEDGHNRRTCARK